MGHPLLHPKAASLHKRSGFRGAKAPRDDKANQRQMIRAEVVGR